ncbi:MAG: tetratricopeptide repeat protein [Betaproteobacteria bacterium]|nr:tetratricopeptide repeat protein [Betaproteobacteria bacterium]
MTAATGGCTGDRDRTRRYRLRVGALLPKLWGLNCGAAISQWFFWRHRMQTVLYRLLRLPFLAVIGAILVTAQVSASPTPHAGPVASGDPLHPPVRVAQQPGAPISQAQSPRGAARAAEPAPALPLQDLTETILYEFLLAEVAAQRGEIGLAAQAYVDLAKRTRDPRIARRATEIATFARMGNAAVGAARIWHETDPRSTRALQSLAGLLIAANRLDEAEPYLKKMLAVPGVNVGDVFTQIGRTLANAPNKAGAVRLVRALAADYPSEPQALFTVAQVAFAAGDERSALEAVRSVRGLRADWEAAMLLEALILQGRSNTEALQALRGFLKANPSAREVRLAYARGLVTDKRFSEARAEFQGLLASFPDNTDVIYAVALLSIQLKDYALAETSLKRLLGLDYRDKEAVRLQLGQIAEDQKRPADALDWYKSVGAGEQYLLSRIRYAQVLAKQGQLGQARAWLQASEITDRQQRVQLLLSEVQLMRDANQIKDAFDLVARELDQLPDNPELLYDHAMLAERLDRIDVLESSLRRLIGIRPDHAHAYNALGYSLADRNMRLSEARELIEKALKLAPEDAFIIDSMGWVLFRQGQPAEALQYLRRAFAARPDPEIAAHLAEVLWTLGNRDEAERIFKDGLEKNPGNDVLLNTLKRIKP